MNIALVMVRIVALSACIATACSQTTSAPRAVLSPTSTTATTLATDAGHSSPQTVADTAVIDAAVQVATTTVVPDAGTPAPTPRGPQRAPQFVLVGLDATPGHDTEHTFSRRVGDAAEAAGARITYFINTQNFLLSPNRRTDPNLDPRDRAWLDPDHRVFGMISYARSANESEGRLVTTRYLLSHGHEIASHGVHHERGTRWTSRQWKREFEVFNQFHQQRLNLPAPFGFRAPYLSSGPNVGPAAQAVGMIYDASNVLTRRIWPGRLRGTSVWEIGVMSLNLRGCITVIFDDGLRMCGMRDESLRLALRDEFLARYNGNRAPFVLSSHDGFVETVYIPLLREICAMPEVRCTTFSEVAQFMSAHPQFSMWGERRSQLQNPPMITPDTEPQN